jgi:pyruvate dehydrogenase E2 component (dihydrolipoamide acetyltransferase)
MAAELGLDLSLIQGTGPKGRIVKRDIEEAAAAGTAKAGSGLQVSAAGPTGVQAAPSPTKTEPSAAAPASFVPWIEPPADEQAEDQPTSTMRQIIARRLTESKVSAPHFYASVELDMKPAIAARESLNQISGGGITFNDMIVKAAALALMRNPAVNASWQQETIRLHKSAHIGVAVSIPDGLIVPVVRACHLKGLAQISREIKDLATRAQDKKLLPEEYQGGTFTVSNLGMLGISHFTGIINPPEACLLAVGAIRAVPVVEDDQVVPGKRMTMTLSCDHRVVDGALAARFLKDLREIIENPASLAL